MKEGELQTLKKVTIIITLVEECRDVSNCNIEEEIRNELSQHLSVIPWAKDVQSVTVK